VGDRATVRASRLTPAWTDQSRWSGGPPASGATCPLDFLDFSDGVRLADRAWSSPSNPYRFGLAAKRRRRLASGRCATGTFGTILSRTAVARILDARRSAEVDRSGLPAESAASQPSGPVEVRSARRGGTTYGTHEKVRAGDLLRSLTSASSRRSSRDRSWSPSTGLGCPSPAHVPDGPSRGPIGLGPFGPRRAAERAGQRLPARRIGFVGSRAVSPRPWRPGRQLALRPFSNGPDGWTCMHPSRRPVTTLVFRFPGRTDSRPDGAPIPREICGTSSRVASEDRDRHGHSLPFPSRLEHGSLPVAGRRA